MLKAATTRSRISTLILLTGTSLLSLNMFMPALPQMAASFNVQYGLMTVAVAGYLVAAAIMQLLWGPLSDRYGRRSILLIAICIFFGASIGGFLATNFWIFLAFRFLQSAVVAGGVISQAIIRDTASDEEAASLLGYVAMVMALAPLVGPALGGAMTEIFGWHSIFLFYSVAGGILLILCWVDVGETNKNQSNSIAEQFRSYPELFRSRRFWAYSLGLMFSIGGFFTFISGAALVVSQEFNLSTTWLGVGIGSISGGFMFGNFVSGRFTQVLGMHRIMVLGRLCAILGPTIGLVLSYTGSVNAVIYFGCILFIGVGNGLSGPSANVGVMSVRPKLAGSAAGMAGAIVIGGGAVFTWLTGVLLTTTGTLAMHLFLILLCSLAGFLCIAYVIAIERRLAATN
ncbi:MAG: MFS transporter [Paracoccaceae bacterium]|nr:MFS transporter [Paracoccaceae bacterium]